MPMNPMQRRARNSFLIGFLIALICMAIVVAMLLKKIDTLEETIASLKNLQKSVLVAADDLSSGEPITMDNFVKETVQTTMDTTQVINDDDFNWFDEEGQQVNKIDEEGNELHKKIIMKIDVPKGTIVTKDMFVEDGQETRDDERLVEYNMILLPSQLKNGDYVDIRLSLASGESYIVVSKVRVIQTTKTGIWVKLNEEEILTLENAIVESYQITGSKLYAVQYAEPGLQEASDATYPVSDSIRQLILTNPNIVDTAKQELINRYNDSYQNDQRVNHIDPSVTGGSNNVQSGVREEASKVQTAREQFIKEMDGTGKVGKPLD